MPTSNVTKDIKELVRQSGYTVLTLSLKELIKSKQYELAARIIMELCLAPRRTETENNGVLCVLRNRRLINSNLLIKIKRLAVENPKTDKILATLLANKWMNQANFDGRTPIFRFCSVYEEAIYYDGKTNFEMWSKHMLCEKNFQSIRFLHKLSGEIKVFRAGSTPREGGWITLPSGIYELDISPNAVVELFGVWPNDISGRYLREMLVPELWYDYKLLPSTALDLVNRKTDKFARHAQNV